MTVSHDYLLEKDQYLDRANLRPIETKEIHNIRAAVRFGRDWSLSAEAKNLTDNRIPDHWGYPLPGRTFFITLEWNSPGR